MNAAGPEHEATLLRASAPRKFPAWRPGLLLVLFVAVPQPSRATIRYVVSLADRASNLFEVTMTVPGVRNGLVVQIPAWNARYQIRDYAAHVVDVRASLAQSGPTDRVQVESPPAPIRNPEELLPIVKLDKQTWQIAGNGTIALRYGVLWNQPDPFSSQLNLEHAFINFADILFYVPDRRSEGVEVDFTGIPPGWKLAAELPPGGSSASFSAASYDALVDAPVEAGTFTEFLVEAGGAHLRVVVDGTGWDQKMLADGIERIVTYQTSMMREVPFREYLLIYHFGAGGGGGMEHANCAAIGAGSVWEAVEVTAHEFFHLWNVKRIRPQSLEPVDYTREQWTRALWFAEGVTSTYEAYTLLRTGLWGRREFLQDLGEQITSLQEHPARAWQSVEQSSLDTWLDKYPLYRRPDVSISYYNKGQILGLLLDILIRDASENHASLDGVLRYLNETFAHQGRFYRDTADIRAAAERFAGRDLKDFFDSYVQGTVEIPYPDFLSRAGLALITTTVARADLGFTPGPEEEGGRVVTNLVAGGAAELAGLRGGDVLLDINGGAFPRDVNRWLSAHRPGDKVSLHVRRSGATLLLSFLLGSRAEHRYQVEEAQNPTEKQRRIREGLLRGTTD